MLRAKALRLLTCRTTDTQRRGYFVFDSPDRELLVSLLPSLVHVRGVERLSVLRACNPRATHDPVGFIGLFEATICRALRLPAAESRLPIPKA